MNWFTRLFAKKKSVPEYEYIETKHGLVEVVGNPFKEFATDYQEQPLPHVRELESRLVQISAVFDERQKLLFKALCVLHDTHYNTFEELVDAVELQYDNCNINNAGKDMIAGGIKP